MPSPEFIAAAYAQETSEAFIRLVRISHPDLPAPMRFAHNTESVTSLGSVHAACFFDCRLPDEGDDKDVVASISIDIVDRVIVETVRSITTPARCTIESVLASDPDVVELQITDLMMRNIKWDQTTMSADLVLDSMVHTPYPKHVFDPTNFPALF